MLLYYSGDGSIKDKRKYLLLSALHKKHEYNLDRIKEQRNIRYYTIDRIYCKRDKC